MEESAMNTTWAAALDDAPRSANLKASVSPPHETVKANPCHPRALCRMSIIDANTHDMREIGAIQAAAVVVSRLSTSP